MNRKLAVALLFTLFCMITQAATNYIAERITVEGFDVIRLADAATQTEVRIAPGMGNNAYSMKVKGHDVMWSSYQTLAQWKAKPALLGNPFLAPFANRIDQDAFYANGKKYLLNAELGNIRRDGNQKPIHGLVLNAVWEVKSVRATDDGAEVTSRLEFWRHPDWMAQFPFAHTLEMTYRLVGGVLEVETIIDNHSTDPLPVSVGYHPYFQLTDAPRDDWQVAVAASKNVTLSNILTPTGETSPRDAATVVALKGTQLDNVFTELVRGKDGRAVFTVKGKSQSLTVEYGPNYPVAVVYAPPGRGFICFEPMAGVTNVFNLGHAGKFPLQSVSPGAQWRESFWIKPAGF
ncbi:MAG: aldose 1-epimerase [Acidobacteria bacterium]|nr:aldose 1-epimerase [Acidobacteriota bacterium]